MSRGRHGDDERAVFAELSEIADETIFLYLQDGIPLPEHRRTNQHSCSS